VTAPVSAGEPPAQRDEHFMRMALDLAQQAEAQGEVPVGAVVVHEGRVVGRGWNQTITASDPTAHAEILALRSAGEALGNYRLRDCDLYVTLEPCPMCAGAMVHARLRRLVFGASDPKTGAAGSVFPLLPGDRHNHRVEVLGGCLEADCGDRLRAFFRARR
jgi:tRNA(adenine34) deaminase